MPSSSQERVDPAKELLIVPDADVLEHADRDDAVETPVNLAEVLQVEATRGRRGPRGAPFSFASSCCSVDSVMPVTSTVCIRREIERKVAPAAADVEDPEARLRGAAWPR